MPPMWAMSPSPSRNSIECDQSSSPERITSESPNGSRRILPRISRKVGAITHDNERKYAMNIKTETAQDAPTELTSGSAKRRRSTSIDTGILVSRVKTSDENAMPHHPHNNKDSPVSSHKARKNRSIPGRARKPNPSFNSNRVGFDNFENGSTDRNSHYAKGLGPQASKFAPGSASLSTLKTGYVSGLLGIKAEPTFNPMLYNASLKEYDSSKVKKNLTPYWFHYRSVSSNLENTPRFLSSSIYYSSRDEYETVNRIDKAGLSSQVPTQREGSVDSLTTEEGYPTDKGVEHKERTEMDTKLVKDKESNQQKEARARVWVENNYDNDLAEEDNYNTRCSGELGKVIKDLQNAVRARAQAANEEDNYNTRCSRELGKAIKDLQNAVRVRAQAVNEEEIECQSSK
ncbi:hypothetical protein DFP73DRAFT_615575 [Morchella snyderi]|nr:hypothetical protein DFP73DRAFT_615575 [Morchella snyderi]